MPTAEAQLDESTVASLHNRIHQLMSRGFSKSEAEARVVAEFREAHAVVHSSKFMDSAIDLARRLVTHEWPEPLSQDEFQLRYLSG